MGLAERVVERFKKAGADSFSDFIPKSDLRAAFAEAQAQARHEHGHGGYSGSIAEKHDYEVRTRTPMTREEASRFINQDIEKNDKWGPAFAIPISEESKAGEKNFKVKVPAKDEYAAKVPAEEAVRAKFPGMSVTIEFGTTTRVKEGKLPEMKVEKGGEKGFKITGPGTRASRDGWENGMVFPSRAEAVAAFKRLVLEVKPQTGAKYQIVAFKTSDTFTIGDTSKAMHLFEVEGKAVLSKSSGKIIGWIFYGYASS